MMSVGQTALSERQAISMMDQHSQLIWLFKIALVIALGNKLCFCMQIFIIDLEELPGLPFTMEEELDGEKLSMEDLV